MKPLAGIILLIALTMPAQAQWGHGGGHGGFHSGGWGHHGFNSGPFGGGLGGFWGGIIGGVIGSQFNRPEPPVVIMRPDCERYRSWDGSSYLGYDGYRHPCP